MFGQSSRILGTLLFRSFQRILSDLQNPHLLSDIHTALNTVSLMNCNRIQANDLKDAFDELSISVKPEEHQMLEKTLDIDGIYNKYKFVFWTK